MASKKKSTTAVLIGVLVACTLAIGQEFEITRYTIVGGGVMRSTGGDFELSGSIGQFDASSAAPKLSGGEFELTGGFWIQTPLGDCEDDGDVDLRDHDLFTACITGPGAATLDACRCFDVNRSNTVDLIDVAIVQTTFTGS